VESTTNLSPVPGLRMRGGHTSTPRSAFIMCIGTKALVERTDRKRPLWRPRRGWEINIKINLQECDGNARNGFDLAQDSDRWRGGGLVNGVMKRRVT